MQIGHIKDKAWILLGQRLIELAGQHTEQRGTRRKMLGIEAAQNLET